MRIQSRKPKFFFDGIGKWQQEVEEKKLEAESGTRKRKQKWEVEARSESALTCFEHRRNSKKYRM